MKTAELRQLTIQELGKKAADLRRELMNLRFQRSGQQLKNPLRLREVRRMIARILTIIKEKGAS
jgi:large subunit ribosomal protein L29